jgi:hypothetical protein
VYTLIGLSLLFFFIFSTALSLFIFFRLDERFPDSSLVVSLSSSFLLLMILGLLSVVVSPEATRIAFVLLLIFYLYVLITSRRFRSFLRVIKEDSKAIIAWVMLALVATIFSSFNVPTQSGLPDGAYVFKEWSKPVQMQWISGGLPMDNALPYYTAEFLVRSQNVEVDHPIFPGQEIILRTYGLPFSYLAIRSLVDTSSETVVIPRFSYVDTEWPDVRPLYSDNRYGLFNGVSFGVLSFLFFCIIYLARRLIGNRFILHITILFTTTPFFLQQTYFTWSKNLALAFALLLFYYRKSQSKFLTSILIFLGFFAHPMFLIYMVALLVFGWLIERKFYGHLAFQYLVFDLTWRLYVFSTGLESNLIQQNFRLNSDIINQIASRVVSIANVLNLDYLRGFPFNLTQFAFGAIGSVLTVSILSFATTLIRSLNPKKVAIATKGKKDQGLIENYNLLIFGFFALLISAAIYSTPAPLIMFGGQILAIAVIFQFSVRAIRGHEFYLPIIANLFIIFAWVRVINVEGFQLL